MASVEPSPTQDLSNVTGMEEYTACLESLDRLQLNHKSEHQSLAAQNPTIVSTPLTDPKCTWLEFLCVTKLDPLAFLPTKEDDDNAGYDLYAFEPTFIQPWSKALIGTKLTFGFPQGLYGRIASRSGLAVKKDIEVGAGVIDRGYRGEIVVLLRNFSDHTVAINRGDKIAQIIFEPYRNIGIKETRNLAEIYGKSKRGPKGFGSSGNQAN